MRSLLPWQLKLLAKLLLSRLRLPYRLFASLGMFRHGDMDNVDYALGVFQRHIAQATLTDLAGKVCLELGPGDALTSALVAHAHGASECYLVDAGAFASTDVRIYQAQANALVEKGLQVPDLANCNSIDAFLGATHCTYLTDGATSLKTLPDNSVDFIWSHAVLEHIRLHEFDATLRELQRILKPDGIMSHRVDLRDHLAASLNNLRFRRAIWEKDWMANSGFYTNRIRFDDMRKRFARAGFGAEINNVDGWRTLPVAREKLDPEFASLDEENLLVQGFNAVLRHQSPQTLN